MIFVKFCVLSDKTGEVWPAQGVICENQTPTAPVLFVGWYPCIHRLTKYSYIISISYGWAPVVSTTFHGLIGHVHGLIILILAAISCSYSNVLIFIQAYQRFFFLYLQLTHMPKKRVPSPSHLWGGCLKSGYSKSSMLFFFRNHLFLGTRRIWNHLYSEWVYDLMCRSARNRFQIQLVCRTCSQFLSVISQFAMEALLCHWAFR